MVSPEQVLTLFTSDPALIAQSADALQVLALSLFLIVPASVLLAAIEGAGDTPSLLWFEIAVSLTVIGVVYLMAIVWQQALAIVWLGEVTGWLLALILSCLWLRRGYWHDLE